MAAPKSIRNNEERKQFEYVENGEIARLEYRFYKNSIAFMHTLVPEALSGKGIASALVEAAFAYAKEIDKKVMVYCSYVGSYVKKHPKLREQLDEEYHRK